MDYEYDPATIDDMLRTIPENEFLKLGMNEVAYVRSEMVQGKKAFVIHAADGTALKALPDEDMAHDAISLNNLETVTVH